MNVELMAVLGFCVSRLLCQSNLHKNGLSSHSVVYENIY